jgi:predicted ArsR family transcriptional regulator
MGAVTVSTSAASTRAVAKVIIGSKGKVPVTNQQIADLTSLNVRTVQKCLRALVAEGRIRYTYNQATGSRYIHWNG